MPNSQNRTETADTPCVEEENSKICGIVRPISEIDGCSESHWFEVHDIIAEAAEKAGFKPQLVSESNGSGLIHHTIVQNLFHNEIVVCDVSAKNPNVMLELGMRLAFNKPTIIIIDDRTDYSFDIGGIEHLKYFRRLGHKESNAFIEKLASKIAATYLSAVKGKEKSFLDAFLGSNASFKDEVSVYKEKLDSLSNTNEKLRREIDSLKRESEKTNKQIKYLASRPAILG